MIKLEQSAEMLLKELAKQGIPAATRNTTRTLHNWKRPKYTDIIAYGIVCIETKLFAVTHKEPMWVWTNLLRAEQDDIAILIDARAVPVYYVFRNDDPVFYHDDSLQGQRGYRAERIGKRKQGLVMASYLTKQFKQAKNNFPLIEQVMIEKCLKM